MATKTIQVFGAGAGAGGAAGGGAGVEETKGQDDAPSPAFDLAIVPNHISAISDDVMAMIMSFLEARDLAMCEQVSRHLREAASSKDAWRAAFQVDFGAGGSKFLSFRTLDPRKQYQARIKRLRSQKESAARALQNARKARESLGRRICMNRLVHFTCYFPLQFIAGWLPLAFLLTMAYKLDDDDIGFSWWLPMGLLAGFFGLMSIGFCVSGFTEFLHDRNVTCCAEWRTWERIPLKHIMRQFMRMDYGELVVFFICLGWASLAACPIFVALKLEDKWDISWVEAFIPMFAGFGLWLFPALFSSTEARKIVAGICAFPIVWIVASAIPLLIRADGSDIPLRLCLIPFFIVNTAYVCMGCIAHGIAQREEWGGRRQQLALFCAALFGLVVAVPVFLPEIFLVLRDEDITDVSYVDTFIPTYIALAVFGAGISLLAFYSFNKYNLKLNQSLSNTPHGRPRVSGLFRVGYVADEEAPGGDHLEVHGP